MSADPQPPRGEEVPERPAEAEQPQGQEAAQPGTPAAVKVATPAETKEDTPAGAEPPTSAATKERSPRKQTTVRPPVVRARARYVRSSARKARMVCGHLRGKSVEEARAILAFASRDVARDWSKLLESAVANAENNHELVGDDLIVREAFADEGPTIKRFRPRAMGRATPIRKRTSHLTITLTPR